MIRSFPKGTSCGGDGLHAQHFLDALNGSAAAVADDLLASITAIFNLLLAGGGIRPIVVGTIWKRLVSKVASSIVGKEMSVYFSDFQFGVGVPCGGEAILHSFNRILDEKCNLNSMSMLLVDFQNAFNLVDKSATLSAVRNKCSSISRWVEFCYASPAKLYYG